MTAEHVWDGVDLDGGDFDADFEVMLGSIIDKCPVAKTQSGWLITRYADVQACANDWQTFSSAAGGVMPHRPEGLPPALPIETDPPMLLQLRKPLLKRLSVTAVATLEDRIRAVAREKATALIGRDGCEALNDYSRPLVGEVAFGLLLGMPIERVSYFQRIIHDALMGPMGGRATAFGEFLAELGAYLEQRAHEPRRDDLVDVLLHLEVDGEDAPFLTKRGMLHLSVVGGLETTETVIGQALRHLGEHPDLRERLVEHPEDIPKAVEEFLRLSTPAWTLGRTTTRSVELQGREVAENEFLLLAYAGANRDPAEFPDPLTFDLDRPSIRHLAFGSGPHRCVGSHLARVELRIALEEFLAANPNFWIDSSRPITTTTTSLARHLDLVPLTFPEPGR